MTHGTHSLAYGRHQLHQQFIYQQMAPTGPRIERGQANRREIRDS
jgi:hypothetical protein